MTDAGMMKGYMLSPLLLATCALRVIRVIQGTGQRSKRSRSSTASRRVSSYVGEILGILRDGLAGLVGFFIWHLGPRAQLASGELIRTRGIGERAKVFKMLGLACL
eukprot:7354514-Pyramimonas_sp.AAC.1